jgi:crotonobetainyl-CoA:carnitine CoA-transferase CaiB-like acyl-CoA transferase
MGPMLDESSVWWSVTGRGKRSVCVDFKQPAGLRIVRALIASADVLVENFRPGVLDRAGLGWDELHQAYPRLVMLSISGYGRNGPYSARPGFGKIAEAFSGATHLTGQADEPPVHPGYSLGDATSGLTGALGVLLALRHRDAAGEGQLVDVALYEPLLRMIEWQVPLHVLLGQEQHRAGANFPFEEAFLTDVCATSDGSNIVVSAATSKAKEAVRQLLVQRELITNPAPSVPEMAAALRGWIARMPRDEALEVLRAHDIVVGPVYAASDLVADEHIAARSNIVTVPGNHGQQIPMPGIVPSLSGTPGEVRWAGPRLGQHTGEVLAEVLGLDAQARKELAADGVIGGDPGQ